MKSFISGILQSVGRARSFSFQFAENLVWTFIRSIRLPL